MAIVDYATLQASIANWLARADLAAVIPDFIQLAEARINRDLSLRQQQSIQAGNAVGSVIALPADYGGTLSLRVSYANGEYEIFPLTAANAPTYTYLAGLPVGYVVQDGNIILQSGEPDMAYTLTYWRTIPSLSDTNQQNWLLTQEPGIYLYGALIEASPYVQDDERTVLWATQYKAIVDGLARWDSYERYGNAPTMTYKGHTP